MSTPRRYRPWVRVTTPAALVNGIRARCWFYLGAPPREGRPKHWRVIQCMTLQTVLGFMAAGRLWLARKKTEGMDG